MSEKINWLLISGISCSLNQLETEENWDLDVGEISELLESFYNSLKDGLPKTKDKWINIFDTAAIACWGVDNTCDAWRDSELKCFIYSMADCYSKDSDVSTIDYANTLGLK